MKEYSVLRTLWENLLSLIGLNLLFWLLCVPVVTAPAAAAALHCACRNCLEGRGRLFRSFFRSFRLCLFSAIPYGLLALVGVGGFLYGVLFYYQLSGVSFFFLVLSLFCLIAGYLLYALMGVTFQLLSVTDQEKPLIAAAMRLLSNPTLLLTWLFLACGSAMLCVWLLPHSLPILLLLGAALPALFAARAVAPIMDTEVNHESLVEKRGYL